MIDECIIWGKAINSSGYPVTWVNGKTVYKHREVVNALPGEVVLHTCDIKSCVNPNHLVKGTHKDNSQDMVNKERQARGELAGNSVLKENEVFLIREFKGKLSSRKVAAIFGISKTNVLDIWKRHIWRHI